MEKNGFKTITTDLMDPKKSLEKARHFLDSQNSALNLLFASSQVDWPGLNTSFSKYFPKNTIGCSSSGEISAEGFSDLSLVGISMNDREFIANTIEIDRLQDFSIQQVNKLHAEYQMIKMEHEEKFPDGKMFAILLIDGLSIKEEIVTSTVARAIGHTPLVGGSASDHLNFQKTRIACNNQFQEGVATLTLVTTTRPFKVFKTQHFKCTGKKLVITKSTPGTRKVFEIDGLPAFEAYARALGLEANQLDSAIFSKYPLMLNIGEKQYVRSVNVVNEDQSLTFFCAIDDGLVVTLAEPKDIFTETQKTFERIEKELGSIEGCILFECILRKQEINKLPDTQQKNIVGLYQKNNAVGFHTYGEQFNGTHINQTLTGIAFGKSK